jgi:hypothetical protein
MKCLVSVLVQEATQSLREMCIKNEIHPATATTRLICASRAA